MQSNTRKTNYQRRKSKRYQSTIDKKIKNLESRLQGEIKKFDMIPAAAAESLSTVPFVSGLSEVAQGDDANDREGLKIKYKYFSMKGICSMNIDAGLVRVIIVKSLKGLIPSALNFIPSVLQPVKYTHTSNWMILYDKTFVVNSAYPAKVLNVYRKLKGSCNYNGTGASDVDNGQLFLYALSSTLVSGNKPLLTADTRIGFIDN